MGSSTYTVIVILVNCFVIKICNEINLKNRKNTNTVIYLIGYTVGCIIMAILYKILEG